MNLRYWSKESIISSVFQEELTILIDKNTSSEKQLSIAQKLLAEGGSLEFGWVADICVSGEADRRWTATNSLSSLVPALKRASLEELKKDLYAPPHSHQGGANYLSTLEIILYFGNSLEEMQAVIKLLDNPPNEIIYDHACDALSKPIFSVTISPELKDYLLNFYQELLKKDDLNYRVIIQEILSLYFRNDVVEALDVLEQYFIINKNAEEQCYILYKVTEPHYGLKKARERFISYAVNFTKEWEDKLNTLDDFSMLIGNLEELESIETLSAILFSKDADNKEQIADRLLGILVEEVEDVLIQLLNTKQVEQTLKQYILSEFLDGIAYHSFQNLMQHVPIFLNKWENEGIATSELAIIQEKYKEAMVEIEKEDQRLQKYKETGYWED